MTIKITYLPNRHEYLRWLLILALLLIGINSALLLLKAPSSPTFANIETDGPGQTTQPHQKHYHREFHLSLPQENTTFTINQLLDLCHSGDALTITKHYALGGDAAESSYLSNCHPIEISTSQAARSRGHCSDFVQYIYYADARLVRDFTGETYKRKVQKCPHSYYLHGEYPIAELFTEVVDPHMRANGLSGNETRAVVSSNRVRNLWMPNWEQIKQEQAWLIRASYMIVCKVHILCTAVKKYLDDENMQQLHETSTVEREHRFWNSTPILRFMSHSSPDASLEEEEEEEDEESPSLDRFNKFYHAFGHSGRKSTSSVIECWLKHPEWPELAIIGQRAVETNKERVLSNKATTNVKLFNQLSSSDLQKLQSSHGVHLCPSGQEGYGHYINEARSLGAVVVTTKHPPMQEFVQDGVSGVLANNSGSAPESYQLMGKYENVAVFVSPENVCAAVETVLKMPLEARAIMGLRARKRYEEDTALMIKNLLALKAEAEEFNGGPFDGFNFLKTVDTCILQLLLVST
ncbi:hypothetical protein HDU77_000410 [Chytriomyces hyalinus]|nr:hypothetical protein HDU77_000410 [Chytriomyces hyalinus]